jgi:hypothetical protein
MCGHGVNLSVHEGTDGRERRAALKDITSIPATSPQTAGIEARPQQKSWMPGLPAYGVVVAEQMS